MMEVEIKGHPVTLLPEKAVRIGDTLFVADLHLGKGHDFRAQGISVPSGSTTESLEALAELCRAQQGLEQVVVLGDLWHSRSAFRATQDALLAWATFDLPCPLALVKGNHDRWSATPPQLSIWEEGKSWGDWRLFHHPTPGAGLQLVGHIHPVARFGQRRQMERLPCFHFDGEILTLPSFGAFTGGHPIAPKAQDQVWVTTGKQVFGVPASLMA